MTTKAQAFASGGDVNTAEKVANNTWRHRGYNKLGALVEAIRLHHTDVVILARGGVMLNSGGWLTVTTKERMTRFAAPVWSERGEWFVSHGGEVHPYRDRMILCHDFEFIDGVAYGAVLYPGDAGYEFAAVEYEITKHEGELR